MNPRGRFRRRTLLAGAVALTAVPAVTACSQDKAETPAISRQQVQDIQDAYAHQLFVAMRTRNQDLLQTIEAAPLLDRDLATIKLGDRLRAPRAAEEYTLPSSTGYPVRSSAGNDQQQLITVSRYSNTRPAWRDLALYVRSGPTGNWLRAYGAGLYASDIPTFGHDHPLTPLPPDAGGYPATPNTIPEIVTQALADPSSDRARMFAETEVRRRYATTLADLRQQAAKIGTVARDYRPGSFVIAIASAGGYLALGTFDYDETLTAHRGKHISFAAKSVEHRLYPGRYRTTTARYGAMFAALVPQHGKIRLISGEQRQTGLAVT